MGEYQALQRLAPAVKDSLTPLLEIPPVGFDFETGQHKESADDHLGDFGRRLKSKWQARRCFVDLKYLPPHTRMIGGKHYVEAVFESARVEGCHRYSRGELCQRSSIYSRHWHRNPLGSARGVLAPWHGGF